MSMSLASSTCVLFFSLMQLLEWNTIFNYYIFSIVCCCSSCCYVWDCYSCTSIYSHYNHINLTFTTFNLTINVISSTWFSIFFNPKFYYFLVFDYYIIKICLRLSTISCLSFLYIYLYILCNKNFNIILILVH